MREKIYWENIFSACWYVFVGLNQNRNDDKEKLPLIILQCKPKVVSNWNVTIDWTESKNCGSKSKDFTRNDKVKRIYGKNTTQAPSWPIIAVWWSGTTVVAGERDIVSHGKSWPSVLEHAVLPVVEKLALYAGGSHRTANGHDPLSWMWNASLHLFLCFLGVEDRHPRPRATVIG